MPRIFEPGLTTQPTTFLAGDNTSVTTFAWASALVGNSLSRFTPAAPAFEGGSKLKAIGEAARKELTELLGQKVHLFLHVKVEENWADSNKEIYEEIGLEWVR